MGRDKAEIAYHDGQPEAERMFELLGTVCERVFFSVAFGAPEQENAIADSAPDQGPIGGLRAAAQCHPDAAWLVVACDMPRFGAAALAELMAARGEATSDGQDHAGVAAIVATAFVAGDGRPHPLAAIYEPAAQAAFDEASPRRVLERISTHLVRPSEVHWLDSFDTPGTL